MKLRGISFISMCFPVLVVACGTVNTPVTEQESLPVNTNISSTANTFDPSAIPHDGSVSFYTRDQINQIKKFNADRMKSASTAGITSLGITNNCNSDQASGADGTIYVHNSGGNNYVWSVVMNYPSMFYDFEWALYANGNLTNSGSSPTPPTSIPFAVPIYTSVDIEVYGYTNDPNRISYGSLQCST